MAGASAGTAGAARAWLPLWMTVTLSATSGSHETSSWRVKDETVMMPAARRRIPGSNRAMRRTSGLTASGWCTNPMSWTVTTIGTRRDGGAMKLVAWKTSQSTSHSTGGHCTRSHMAHSGRAGASLRSTATLGRWGGSILR